MGAARRSLRVAIIGALIAAGCSILGAVVWGIEGTIYGLAVGVWVGAAINWFEFRKAWQEAKRARAVTHKQPSAAADSAQRER
jgi:Na+-driven multidrug efflux pump